MTLPHSLRWLLPSFALLAQACASAPRPVPPFQKEVDPLVSESRKSAPACEKYAHELQGLTSPDATQDVFTDKARALAVAKKSKDYPGTPAPAQQLYRKVLISVPLDLNAPWFVKTLGEVQGSCSPWIHYDALKKLLLSTRALRFTPSETARIRETVLHYVLTDNQQPDTLLPYLLKIEALKHLIDTQLLRVKPALAPQVAELFKAAESAQASVRERLDEVKPDSAPSHAEALLFELRTANELREKLRFLLDQLELAR